MASSHSLFQADTGLSAEDLVKKLPLARLRGKLPSITDNPAALETAISALATASGPIAIDTERAQGFRYGQDTCLVQIKRGQAGTFLIDSHALPNLHELGAVLDGEWIFHAATQDLPALAAQGMVAPSLFDTETAARLVGFRRFSLSSLAEQLLGLKLEKSHQAEDWSVRPLPRDWLRYAAMDVELLQELRDLLVKRLEKLGRHQWAQQEFDYQLTHVLKFHEPHWRELKGIGRLQTARKLAIARELFNVREAIGKQEDLATSLVLSAKGIIEAAEVCPLTRNQFMRLRAFQTPQARPHREEFWAAIVRARMLSADELPNPQVTHGADYVPPLKYWKRSYPEAHRRLLAVRELVEARGQQLDLDPQVVLQPKVQRQLAWKGLPSAHPEILVERLQEAEARPWQIEQCLIAVRIQPEGLASLTR